LRRSAPGMPSHGRRLEEGRMILYRVDRGRPDVLPRHPRPPSGRIAGRGRDSVRRRSPRPVRLRACSRCGDPVSPVCGRPGSSHAESRFRPWHAVSARS
jgi:hypothetical protein